MRPPSLFLFVYFYNFLYTKGKYISQEVFSLPEYQCKNGGPTAVISFTTTSEAHKRQTELLLALAVATIQGKAAIFIELPIRQPLFFDLFPRRSREKLAFAILPDGAASVPSTIDLFDLTPRAAGELLESDKEQELNRYKIAIRVETA